MKQNLPIALALRGVSKRFDRPAVDALYLTVYGDRARGLGIVGRARHSSRGVWRIGRRLADQPIAGVRRRRCRPTRIPTKSKLRMLAPMPVANAGA